ncbi:relaxase/mobilization nuclease domain-containing protein (plasmid) [Methylomonas sp. 2BW1-5-20]|uniref:relaxase/mobilization nuclease domain-containing protein n=1 Tax=Methylomonas sp. 2BW1-5-20 TaxID=3376686 RepID=UPI004050D135
MIVKARAGKGGQSLARYLESGKNEHAEVLEYRNMDAASLRQAIFRMDNLAERSNCENHAYHVQMRAAYGERLSAEHWQAAAERVAEAFGMEDHQAAVVLHHQQDGTTHCHLVINRVNPETMKAADLWQDRIKCKELARQMELDWGLRIVTSEKTQARDHSRAGRPETEQARRTGENVHDIRDQIRHAWETTDNALDFAFALAEEGYTLAKGDRRDFVAVAENGNVYSIGKRTTGAAPAQIKDRMAGLDNGLDVPTLDEVRLAQQLAAEEELKNEKERKGKGDASAAHAMKEAQDSKEKTKAFYIDDETRRQVWEKAAAARLERMRDRHAREYDRQQRGFERNAHLERGASVQDFNHIQRHDLTAALLKGQADELAAELKRQSDYRQKRAEYETWRQYRDRIEAKGDKPEMRRGGFKQRLREELPKQTTYTNTDATAAERAQNQAARERQEQARQHPKQAWHELHREQADQQSREKVQTAQAKREERIKRMLKQWRETGNENDGGREFEP